MAVVVLLLTALYLHHFGLPAAVSDLLLGAVRAQGINVQFSRLRLHWYRGFVADDVSLELGRAQAPPRLWCREMVINLDWAALARQQFEIAGLDLLDGHVVLPLNETNQPAESLPIENLAARLRLGPRNLWRLDELHASTPAGRIQAYGVLTNGPSLGRTPRTGASSPETGAPALPELRERLRAFKRLCDNLTFSTPPDFTVQFSGDARQPATWQAEIRARAAGCDTPWGRLEELQAHARLLNAATTAVAAADLTLDAGALTTVWGNLQSLRLHATATRPWGRPDDLRLRWELGTGPAQHAAGRADALRWTAETLPDAGHAGLWQTTFDGTVSNLLTAPARSARSEIRGRLLHSLTNPLPEQLTAHLVLDHPAVAGGTADHVALDLELHSRNAPPLPAATTVRTWLDRFQAGFNLQAREVDVPQVRVNHLLAAGAWTAPQLTLTNFQAGLLDGTLQITRASLNADTREVSAELAVDFDVQRLDRALPQDALRWLSQFQYDTPPHAAATVRGRLPSPGLPPRERDQQLLQSLDLRVRIDGRDARYRGLGCDSAGVTLSISNAVLRLRDLVVHRPEGRARLTYDLDLLRRDFRWKVDCALDPHAAAPAVDPGTLPQIVEQFDFTTPPHITGEVWGNWNPPRPLGFDLAVHATNLTLRGEAFDTLAGRIGKTNEFITATAVRATRGDQWVDVPWTTYDLTNRLVSLTNATSLIDPQIIARCIGTSVVETLRPYQFAAPPRVTTSGVIPVDGSLTNAAMTFDVAGGPFRFWRFNLPEVQAGVRWRGDSVSVTNVAATFYGGRLSGGIDLEMLGGGDALFRLQALGSDFNVQPLLRDILTTSTNQVEGVATVSLIVTDAHTADWKSWYGRGHAELRNGVIWDLPIFGVFSQGLNVVLPGIGNSRASAARGSYQIQKSVIHTDDLAIEAGPARLQYRGSVDFDGRLDARVVAEVLHSTPLIGPLLSLALAPAAKVMEYKVTGTLADPELKPLNIPGFLRPLLNPVGTLGEVFIPKAQPPSTNGPAPAPKR